MTQSSSAEIFLSYAHEDKAVARQLTEYLRTQGWSVFWDHEIPVGKTWREHVGLALQECRCMVVLWSQHSLNSNWVKEEADEGLKRKLLVPALLQSIEPPLGFRSIQAANLSDWSGDPGHPGLETLTHAVQRLLGNDRRESVNTTSVASVTPAIPQPNDVNEKPAWNRRAVVASAVGATTLLAAGAAAKFWSKTELPAQLQPAAVAPTSKATKWPRLKRRGPKSVQSTLSAGFYTNKRTSIIHRVLVAGRIGHVSAINERNLRAYPSNALRDFELSAQYLPRAHLSASSQAFEDAALDLVRQENHLAAIDLLRVSIIHDLEMQRRSKNKPSLRLYDLFAGLSIRYGQTQQLQSVMQIISETKHAPLFVDRVKRWTDSGCSWHKGWSKKNNGKCWSGLPM